MKSLYSIKLLLKHLELLLKKLSMSKFIRLQPSWSEEDWRRFQQLVWFTYEYGKADSLPFLQPYLAGEEAREEDEEEESSADEPGLEIVEPSPAEEEGEDDMDMLSDIPPEALSAHTRSEFVNHMRPYVWVKYPSATSMEINAFINARWNLLKASRKFSAG